MCPAVLLSGLNLPQGHQFPHVLQHTTSCQPLILMRGSMPVGNWKRHVDDTRSSGDDGDERGRIIILRKVKSEFQTADKLISALLCRFTGLFYQSI